MDIQAIRDSLPDYARDLRLNLGSVLAPTGAPGLDETQIWGIALASAIAARSPVLTAAIERHAREHGGDATVEAAKGGPDLHQHATDLCAHIDPRRVSSVAAAGIRRLEGREPE
jgi:alkyl hydroperoxide reductase subunit D